MKKAPHIPMHLSPLISEGKKKKNEPLSPYHQIQLRQSCKIVHKKSKRQKNLKIVLCTLHTLNPLIFTKVKCNCLPHFTNKKTEVHKN